MARVKHREGLESFEIFGSVDSIKGCVREEGEDDIILDFLRCYMAYDSA